VSHTSNTYRTNGEISHDIDDNELQYLTPHTHKGLLDCDGIVDRTQVDKMYVLIKSVNLKGKEKLYFIGTTEIVKRRAEGICDAIKLLALTE